MKRAVALSICLTFAAAVPAAEVGRLFFTPSERAQLDVARTQKKAPPPTASAHAQTDTPVPEIVSYGGIVRRSDGKALLWLNNRVVEEKEALGALSLKGSVRSDGAVTLQMPESGSSIEVKVGQSVDLQSGRVAERHKAATELKPVRKESKSEPADNKAAAATAKSGPTDSSEKKPDAERKDDAAAPTEKQRPVPSSAAAR